LFSWFFSSVENTVKEADTMLAQGDRSQNWGRVRRQNELMLDEPHIPLGDLRRIQAPALIIGGDEDVITPEHLLEIYRSIPKAHLFIVPGATHFALREEYELYNAAAERFLRRPFERPTTRQVLERR
jgi:pimeloyl-ACP methyl ester carboxylesterase